MSTPKAIKAATSMAEGFRACGEALHQMADKAGSLAEICDDEDEESVASFAAVAKEALEGAAKVVGATIKAASSAAGSGEKAVSKKSGAFTKKEEAELRSLVQKHGPTGINMIAEAMNRTTGAVHKKILEMSANGTLTLPTATVAASTPGDGDKKKKKKRKHDEVAAAVEETPSKKKKKKKKDKKEKKSPKTSVSAAPEESAKKKKKKKKKKKATVVD